MKLQSQSSLAIKMESIVIFTLFEEYKKRIIQ